MIRAYNMIENGTCIEEPGYLDIIKSGLGGFLATRSIKCGIPFLPVGQFLNYRLLLEMLYLHSIPLLFELIAPRVFTL